MIRSADLMPSVIQLLYPPQPAIENPITPRRGPFLLTRIVLVRTNIVLVRRGKSDGCFVERAQPETRVLAARSEELVAVEEFGEVVLADGVDDDVAGDRVDAVVEVAVYNADFVVHDHGAVAAADEVVCAGCEAGFAGEAFCL